MIGMINKPGSVKTLDNSWIVMDTAIRSSNPVVTINENYDDIEEFAFRCLGGDGATFFTGFLPKEQWHNSGTYAHDYVVFNGMGQKIGNCALKVQNKTSTSFEITYTTWTNMNNVQVAYRLKNKVVSGEKYTDTYSTSEVKTNKVWIDGKPIYRKVVVNEPFGESVEGFTIPLGDASMRLTIPPQINCVRANGASADLSWYDRTATNIYTSISNNTYSLKGNATISDLYSATWYITLEYTKTTD